MSSEKSGVRDALSGLTTSIPSEDVVLRDIRRRTVVRERRHRVVGAGVLAAAVGVVGLFVTWRPAERDLHVVDDGTISTTSAPVAVTTTVVPATLSESPATETTQAPSTSEAFAPDAAPTAPPATITPTAPSQAPRPTTPRTAPPTAPPTAAPLPEPPPQTAPTTMATTNPTTPPTPVSTTVATTTTVASTTVPAPIRKTRTSDWGSVTVESVGSNELRVVDAAPGAFHTMLIEQASGREIVVVFLRDNEGLTEIRVSATFTGKRIPFVVVKTPVEPPATTSPPTTAAGGG